MSKGLKVDLFGSVGSDFIGYVLTSLMKKFGIETSFMQVKVDSKTSATVINVRNDGERPALHQLGAADYLGFEYN